MSPIDIGTGSGEGNNAYGTSLGGEGTNTWTKDNMAQPFGISRSDGGLDLWADVVKPHGGWAVYTFSINMPFLIYPGATILADILLIGGGGSGGPPGFTVSGGGGAGGFVDKHDAVIYSHEKNPPRDGGFPDGDVVIGNGGVVADYPEHAQGEDSKLGDGLTAFGGGYGGWIDGPVHASNGGSGGGSAGHEILDDDLYMGVQQWHGTPGAGLCHMNIPEGEDARDYEQGHDGGRGHDTASWYDHSGGGGGGANWPANGYGYGAHGGLGRPCDIAGWYQSGSIYEEAGWRMIPWFCGGGGGGQRPNDWGYPDGFNGYGRAGGAGGHAGSDGQGGLVIVRIPLVYKQWITSPLQLSADDGTLVFDPVWDPWQEEYVDVARMPEGVTYHELPESQPHTDMMGEEMPVYYAWPDNHLHHWGWE